MSDNKDIISFLNTGLDTDSDLLALGDGNSRYRLNVSISDDGNNKVLTNIKGNTLKSHTLSTGDNKVVGTIEDKENDALIYFVNNSNNDHSIVRYNNSGGDFDNILSDEMVDYDDVSALNIPSDRFVDAGIIGNEDDQFLVWADGDFLKMINIQHAIDGNYNTTLTEEEISFYKYPLNGGDSNITASYVTGTENNDKIYNKIFQFAIRAKYYDKTYSVLSNRSEIAFPEESIPSGKISSSTLYEHIAVGFDMQLEPSIVDSYQLIYRIVDIGDGASGVWNIYDDYDYSAKGVKSVEFKNDKSIGTVSDDDAGLPYDFVPNKVNHIGIINSNIVVTNVAEEGFDNVDLTLTNAPTITLQTNSISSTDGVRSSDSSGTPTTISESALNASDFFIEIVVGTGRDTFTAYTYNLSMIDLGLEIKTYFEALISGLTVTNNSTSDNLVLQFASTGSENVTYTVLNTSNTYRTLKTGASYKFGVEYGFNGKRGSVQTSNDFVIDAPDISDAIADTFTYNNYISTVDIALNNTPPTGATDFRLVSFGSNIEYFEEYLINFNYSDITDNATDYTAYLEDNMTVIKKDEILNRMRAAYGDEDSSINYGFNFQAGDYIKAIGFFSKDLIQGTFPNSDYVNYDVELVANLDFRIDVVTSTEIKLTSSFIRQMEQAATGTDDSFWLIQIIRYKDNFDATSQEFSLSYPISAHGDTITITDYFSDVWKSKQVYLNALNKADYGNPEDYCYSWMEKPSISLYYDSTPVTQGRVNVVNEFAEQRGDRKIRWGGKFLDEAGINFLTKFESDNEAFLDDRNGAITKIQQIGDTLKVYQDRKVTSFYLNKKSSTDSEGNTTFLYSSEIIDPNGGSQSAFDNGCTNFESYVKNLKQAYFFDVINSQVIRDSLSGLEPISEYGMHTFFKEKANRINQLGRDLVNVHGMYDDDNDIYIITVVCPTDLTDTVNFSAGFHEPTNRWVSFYSLPTATSAVEYYGRLSGNTFVSFVDGQLYTHNTNSLRNNFWGTQRDSYVQVHSSLNPNLIKVWDNVEIISTGQWAPSEDGDVEVSLPTEQQSRLKAGKFELQEGEYRSEFLRDMLSGASFPIENNLFNGDALRGYVISLLLRNSDTSEANLRIVKVNGTTST